jgi:hypothetical protein
VAVIHPKLVPGTLLHKATRCADESGALLSPLLMTVASGSTAEVERAQRST